MDINGKKISKQKHPNGPPCHSMPELRERRRLGSLSYMPLPIIPLTNQWSHSPPGSIIAFGATKQPMPSSKTWSMTLTTGGSLQMSIATANTTKNSCTSPKRWSSGQLTSKASTNPAPSVRNNSSPPASQTKSNTSCFAHLQGSSS